MPYADHAILLVLMFFQPAFSEAAVQIRKRFAVVVVCGVLAGTGQADAANELSAREAAAIAMKNAGVAAEDIFNLKTEHDEENGIAVYAVEFETKYGDYDFCVARRNGRIIDADCEVREEWIRRQPAARDSENAVRLEVVRRVPGASSSQVLLRRQKDRWEGLLRHDGFKYEFEADRRTGIISDWNAEMRR